MSDHQQKAERLAMWYCPICLHIMNECQSKHYAGCPTDKHGIVQMHLAQHTRLDLATLLAAKAELAQWKGEWPTGDYYQVLQERDAAKAELESVKKQRDGNWIDKWGACKLCGGEIPHGHTENCDMWKIEKECNAAKAELEEMNNRLRENTAIGNEHEQYSKVQMLVHIVQQRNYFREQLDTTRKERDQLRAELAMANDAAEKGKAGRELGTSLEGCMEENKQLRADLEAVRNSYRAGNEPLAGTIHTRNMCELFDVRDRLRSEMANGQKQLSALEDTIWKREKELAELHEAFADALKMGEQTRADNADKERKLKLVGYYGDNGKEVRDLLAENTLLRAVEAAASITVTPPYHDLVKLETALIAYRNAGYKL